MEITKENAEKELYDFRVRFGITQDKLSEKTGITRQTISAIEKGKKKPQAVTIFKINEYINTFVYLYSQKHFGKRD